MKKQNVDPEVEKVMKYFDSWVNYSFTDLMDNYVLFPMGIENESDLSRFDIDEIGRIINPGSAVDSGVVPMLMFYSACNNQINHVRELHENKKMHFIHDMRWRQHFPEYIPLFATIFPKRLILHSTDVASARLMGVNGFDWSFGLCDTPNIDMIRTYLRYKPLFEEGLIHFIQQMYVLQIDRNYATLPYINLSKHKNMTFIDDIGDEITPLETDVDLKQIITEFPWLKNAFIEDYVELGEKHKLEYKRLQIKFDELIQKSKKGANIGNTLIKEYNEASLEIRNIIINRRDEIKRKGRDIAIGTILACIPIALEQANITLFDPKVLSTVIGGATLFNGVKDFFSNSRLERKNPYWVIWEWEEKSKRKIENL